MLSLIQTEFLKLRRKKYVWLMMLAALFMPVIALLYFRGGEDFDSVQFYKWAALSYTPWIILPVVMGMLCTMLMHDEHQHGMLHQIWIVPVGALSFFFSKFAVVALYSVGFMLSTAIASIACGVLPGYIPLDLTSVRFLLVKCLEIGVLTAFAILPILSVAATQKGYILPVCLTLMYTFLGFIMLMINMYLMPLSSMTAIVVRNIPGAVLTQELNIPAATACIAAWGAASVAYAGISLRHRK